MTRKGRRRIHGKHSETVMKSGKFEENLAIFAFLPLVGGTQPMSELNLRPCFDDYFNTGGGKIQFEGFGADPVTPGNLNYSGI